MARFEGRTTRDLADELLKDARNHSFYMLLENLHGLHGDNLEDAGMPHLSLDRVRLGTSASLGFPASDIVEAHRIPGTGSPRYRVRANFLGLHGVDSPLAGYYVDAVAHDAAQGEGTKAAFLDFFNHRLLTFLHVGWRKYRYYARFRPRADDQFSRYVFSLIGLNDEKLRGDTPIPWSRLLTYAGLIASRSRSPDIVAGIVAHCLDLDTVQIREFVHGYVGIPDQQRTKVGLRNAMLGIDLLLGERVDARSNKFTIVIEGLTERRFRDFLPDGASYHSLRRLIDFLMRDPLAYDIKLGLLRDEVPMFSLHRVAGANLGWTTFLGDPSTHLSRVTIRGRA